MQPPMNADARGWIRRKSAFIGGSELLRGSDEQAGL
jgi:hypothetical protein